MYADLEDYMKELDVYRAGYWENLEDEDLPYVLEELEIIIEERDPMNITEEHREWVEWIKNLIG